MENSTASAAAAHGIVEVESRTRSDDMMGRSYGHLSRREKGDGIKEDNKIEKEGQLEYITYGIGESHKERKEAKKSMLKRRTHRKLMTAQRH